MSDTAAATHGSSEALGGRTGTLTTVDCIAQSLAVGPIFSAAVLGGILAGLAGGVGPFVIVLTTVGILGLGYLVAELAKRYSGSGTVYEYIAKTLGTKVAVFSAGAYHLAAISLYAGIPIVGGSFLKGFCAAHLGFDPPWWVMALLFLAAIVVINVIGVEVSVRTQLTIVIASTVPFLILAVAIIVDGGVNGNTVSVFNPANVAEGGSVSNGLLFAILMFVGFELAAALGEETENPHRSIPIAIIATILIVAVFYVLTQYVGTIGSSADIPFDFGVLGEQYVGRWLAILIELATILDILAVGIGFCAAPARGIFTLARDRLLPSRLADVNDRRVPGVATLAVGGIGLVVLMIAFAVYGNDPADTSLVPPPSDAFKAFTVTSTIGAFVIAIVYVILCIGGIHHFVMKERRPAVAIAGLIGLLTAGAGVAAQFIDATAPVGDARWGRHLGLVVVAVVLAWTIVCIVARPADVERAASHTLAHVPTGRVDA